MKGIKDVQGRIVVSLDDGRVLGEIKDLYLDVDVSKCLALYLGKSGIINRKTLLVPFSEVTLKGIDAWLVTSSEKLVGPDDFDGALIPASSLFGREIQTPGGTRIGTIGDLLLNDHGEVSGFQFDKLMVEGPLSESNTIARQAVSDLGSDKSPALADLEKAEQVTIS